MIRRTSFLLLLLVMWIVQGCASYQHPTPTPYRKILELRQVEVLPDKQDTMERSATLPENSIVKGISDQANQLILNGELGAAAQTIERGLRIAPKEAFLWSQLATVRLRQHRYNQAQSLAAKSSSLAPENSALISRNQKIIEFAGK